MPKTMNVAISPELKSHAVRQDQRRAAEQRSIDLLREGLGSPEEPADPAFW